MQKTEVYSWRVSSRVKQQLEDLARRDGRTIAAVLDDIVAAHLGLVAEARTGEDIIQRELHNRAARFAGRIAGTNPRRSTTVHADVLRRLRKRRHAER
jgi:hypothetical protein